MKDIEFFELFIEYIIIKGKKGVKIMKKNEEITEDVESVASMNKKISEMRKEIIYLRKHYFKISFINEIEKTNKIRIRAFGICVFINTLFQVLLQTEIKAAVGSVSLSLLILTGLFFADSIANIFLMKKQKCTMLDLAIKLFDTWEGFVSELSNSEDSYESIQREFYQYKEMFELTIDAMQYL